MTPAIVVRETLVAADGDRMTSSIVVRDTLVALMGTA